MDDLIRLSIDSRKQAIYNMYNVTDKELINKIDNLFDKIYEFGNSCTDNMDFETKFASNSLNQEYINLFTELSSKYSMKTIDTGDNNVENDSENLNNNMVSDIKYQADELARPIRRKVKQEAYDKVRDVPVIGEALNVKQHVDFFSRFKKKKED